MAVISVIMKMIVGIFLISMACFIALVILLGVDTLIHLVL